VQARVLAYVLLLRSIELLFGRSLLQRNPDGLLRLVLSLSLEDVDFILKAVIYFLLFADIKRSVRTPRNLSITLEVHVEQV